MTGINWVALIVMILLFALVTVMGFMAARWRRPKNLDSLNEWGLGGKSFGTVITWFLLAIPIGILSALRPRSLLDKGLMILVLIGASAQSVYNWEEGKARPRAQHLPAIFALRNLGRRQANEILESRKAA